MSEYVKLRVVGQDFSEIQLYIEKTMQMDNLKMSFSEWMVMPNTSFRFLFDGQRINDEDTPVHLGVEHDDVIEVTKEQTGGGMVVYETLQESSEATMKLKIIGNGQQSVTFRIKPDMEIGDLKKAYAQRVGVSVSRVKFSFFSFQSKRIVVDIRDDRTPETLGMGPDDVLRVGPLEFNNLML